jgi:plastocyanin
MRRWRRAVVLASVGAAIGCGGRDHPTDPGPVGSTSSNVSVRDNAFDPSATTVPVGTSVTWTWTGSAQHNVTFDDGPASGTQGSGTYQRAFSTAGFYKYHCTVHGTAMAGTVTVQ